MGLRERAARLRGLPRDLAAPVAVATLLVLLLNALTLGLAGGGFSARAATGALAATAILFLLSFVVGRYLGGRVWPDHGGALARRVLGRYARKWDAADLVMSGRAEFPATTRRRVAEATALVAGANVLFVVVVVPAVVLLGSLIPFVGALAGSAALLVAGFVGVVYLTLVLVPHWAFAELGLRRLDRARFLLIPLTRDYSERLRISNGAIVLLALGIGSFVLRQQGRSDVEALRAMVGLLMNVVFLTLVLMATAVAYFGRREREVLTNLAREASALGCRDGRGESEAELFTALVGTKRVT